MVRFATLAIVIVGCIVVSAARGGTASARGQAPDIFQSVRAGDLAATKALIAANPRLANATDPNGRTLLHVAVATGNVAMARLLIDEGALVRVGDANLRAPIHLANQLSDRPMVELLLEKGAVVDTRAIGAATPLIHASLNANFPMARLLIDRGADIDVQCNSLTVPLYFAVLNNDVPYLEYLLGLGADVDVPDFLGRTPLSIAVRDGRAALVERLVAHGANPRRTDDHLDQTLLHLAAIEGHDAVVETLLALGLPVNDVNGRGWTPLDCASQYGHRTTADLLASRGAKAGKRAGNSAAMSLPASGEARAIKLQNGAWAIETSSAFLVFAYSEIGQAPAGRSLANGHVTPELLAGGKRLFYIAHEVHPEVSRLGLVGSNPVVAMAREHQGIQFVVNAAVQGAYGSAGSNVAAVVTGQQRATVAGLAVSSYHSYGSHLAYVLTIDGVTIAWITGICDNYQPFRRDATVIGALGRDGVRPDILLLGSPSGIGPEIGSGIRETYVAALTLQPRAVFTFGHEPLERRVRGQLERRRQDVGPLRTAGSPGDRFLIERRLEEKATGSTVSGAANGAVLAADYRSVRKNRANPKCLPTPILW